MENQSTILDRAVKPSVIVGVLIATLSISYYLVVFLPQKEKARLEQQMVSNIQQTEMAQKKEGVESIKQQAIKESQQQEYILKKKSDCLQIYKTENTKWSNVVEYEYNEKTDKCSILYASQEKKRSFDKCNAIGENGLQGIADNNVINIDGIPAEDYFNEEVEDCLNNITRTRF